MNLKVLKSAWLIDGCSGTALENGWVITEGSTIKELGSGTPGQVPRNTEVIDLPGCTLMPGLMDVHMHLAAPSASSFSNYRIATFEVPAPLQLLYAAKHARIMLEAGFTTIRDLDWPTSSGGHIAPSIVALRDAIAAGVLPGPRIVVGGWVHITSSHFDLVLPRTATREPGFVADGPWELRRLARENLRAGVDVLKTCASGGVGTDNEEVQIRNMTQEELEAIVDEGHAFGKRVAAHCHTADSIRMAVKAKVDTIEHCVFTDDDAIALLVRESKLMVPTLAHRSDRAIEIRQRVGTSEFTLDKMRRTQKFAEDSFRKAHTAGVRMAMGTDTQIDPYMGDNAFELEIYVRLGMTPMEAIKTATANAAEALGLQQTLGTLESGKLADLIAVQGNPVHDIRVLQDKKGIRLVIKGGVIAVSR